MAVHVRMLSLNISGEGTWTPDRTDMSRLLYQLSYAAKSHTIVRQGQLYP